MTIRIEETDQMRVVYDDMNPRIYGKDWKCAGCGDWIPDDEVVWASDVGVLNTDTGKPWCVGCCPSEEESL